MPNENKSAKTTNAEIVKSLITITQDFYDNNIKIKEGMSAAYGRKIDETNLVASISQALYAYRRQQDRIADILSSMEKIVSGG